MKRRLGRLIALISVLCLSGVAQEKPTPVVRPQPDIRGAVVPPNDSLLKSQHSDSSSRSPQGLPKFDLQRFVITGSATIDLPDAEKLTSEIPSVGPEMADPVNFPRDRATVEFTFGEKELLPPLIRTIGNGRIQASVGTFLKSQVGLSLSWRGESTYLSGDGRYEMIRAFTPFANRSGGFAGVTGGMTLRGPSEWYDGGKLRGETGYGSETYRFYGSSTPSLTRTISRFKILANYSSPLDLLYNYGGHVGMSFVSISDSTKEIGETQFNVGIESNLLLAPVELDAMADVTVASLSNSGAGTLPMLELRVKTRRMWWGGFYLQGSAGLYVTQGMLGQRLSRVYPQAEIGYRFAESSVASVSYLGRVQFNTLNGLVQNHPYLSGAAIIRQSDVPVDVLAVLQTDWSDRLRTRLSARYQSILDFPLFSEGGLRGVWSTVYLGRTNLTTVEASLFAKFAANGYFMLSIESQGSKNTGSSWRIPYFPDFRMNAAATYEIAERLKINPVLSIVGRRGKDLYTTSTFSGYFLLGLRAEYSALQALDVFMDFRNLTNTRYEDWNGYQATPFVAAAGVSLRW